VLQYLETESVDEIHAASYLMLHGTHSPGFKKQKLETDLVPTVRMSGANPILPPIRHHSVYRDTLPLTLWYTFYVKFHITGNSDLLF